MEDQWPYIVSLLPADYEETAKLTGALVRRRAVKTASDLLRLVMSYGLCGMSLRGASAWAGVSGLAKLSDVAVLKRLKGCNEWLGVLITQKLEERMSVPDLPSRLRVRIVDASCINRPGSKGPDWRLHLGFDLGKMCLDDVWLTSAKTGETLRNFAFGPGEVVIGDRIYGERKGIEHVVSSGADVIVRINWHNVPLLKQDGTAFDIIEHARSLPDAEYGEWSVMTAPSESTGSISGRLIILRKSPEATEKERRRLTKEYRKKGRTPDERTLEAAGYVFVFTTLASEYASALEVLELYRFRWQIELAIKRLKSILQIGEMKALSDELCRTFLLAKLLAALMIEDIAQRVDAFSPWGYGRPAPGIAHKSLSNAGRNVLRCGGGDTNSGEVAC